MSRPACGSILGSVIRTRTAYLAALPEHIPAVSELYRVEAGPRMVRMWVDRATFHPVIGEAVRLDAGDTRHLNRLYELGLTAWLPVRIGRAPASTTACAGRAASSPPPARTSSARRMASRRSGNVFTHRDMRGRGLAKAVTSAVTAELLETVDTVVLNVRVDNVPALAAYRALGYQPHMSLRGAPRAP